LGQARGTNCRVTIRISPIPSGCGDTRTTMPRRNALPMTNELCTTQDFDLGSDMSVWLSSFLTNSRGFCSALGFSGVSLSSPINNDSHVRKTTSDLPSSRRNACLMRPWVDVNAPYNDHVVGGTNCRRHPSFSVGSNHHRMLLKYHPSCYITSVPLGAPLADNMPDCARSPRIIQEREHYSLFRG
jgi:hypothetical protein